MGLVRNYFEKHLTKLNVNKKENGYQLSVNCSFLGKRLDNSQDMLDLAIWNDIKKYMPVKNGTLVQRTQALNLKTRGEVYLYDPNLPYGHYQYEGIVYKDPVYNAGGFTDGDGNWWSRKGVKKVMSDQPLFYTNPLAEAHWEEVAIKNHKNDWVKIAKRGLK